MILRAKDLTENLESVAGQQQPNRASDDRLPNRDKGFAE
jgi:hypothetical protein